MPFGKIGNWFLFAKDVVTGKLTLLKSKNGALQVDLVEMEQVQISLPDGANLNVEIQNTDPIPVDLPAEKVVDVEIQNTDPIPVDLPAEKVVDVEIQNTDPIPVDLPAEKVVDVDVKNTDPIPVDLPAEKVVDVDVKNTDPIPVDLPAEKVVDVDVKNADPIPVDLPAEKVVDVEVQNTDPIPVDLPGGRIIPVTPDVLFLEPVILETDSDSEAMNGNGKSLVELMVPEGFTGDGIIILTSSSEEGSYQPRRDEVGVIEIPLEAESNVAPIVFALGFRGLGWFKIRAMEAGSPVVQDENVTIGVKLV